MSDERRVLVLEPATSELKLGKFGHVIVREPSMAAEQVLDADAWADETAGSRADVLLAACLQPPVAPAEIAGLGERDRRSLMLAIIRLKDGEKEWRALYGSDLSLDQRFESAMRSIRDRELRATLAAVRKAARRAVMDPNAIAADYAKRLPNVRGYAALSGRNGPFAILDNANRFSKMLSSTMLPGLRAFSQLGSAATLDVVGKQLLNDRKFAITVNPEAKLYGMPGYRGILGITDKFRDSTWVVRGLKTPYLPTMPKVVFPDLLGNGHSRAERPRRAGRGASASGGRGS